LLRRTGLAAMNAIEPESAADVVAAIQQARGSRRPLWFKGSGTTNPPDDTTVVSTRLMKGVVDYKPDDLTVVVRAGTTLSELESVLSDHGHSGVLPETAGYRTVGGVIASGASGYGRLRYGPTRDRVIGVTLVTGYGEVVHGGGQLVKNVTGYDLPRLVTGSHGSLGCIAEVALKLWPEPANATTVKVENIAEARLAAYRPLAAIETEDGGFLYESGHSDSESELRWPKPIAEVVHVALNVPPRLVPDGVQRVRDGGASRFTAQHGVGVVEAGWSDAPKETVAELREWAESEGGSVELVRGSGAIQIPRWGAPPDSVDIQQRMKELFDPDRVCNPGVLPGGV
jgi:FAD/FMN-containing dehydrogenase